MYSNFYFLTKEKCTTFIIPICNHDNVINEVLKLENNHIINIIKQL